MTECTRQEYLFQPIAFQSEGRRQQVVASFRGGEMSSDGGLLLFRELEKRLGILERFAKVFQDHRNPSAVEYSVKELVSQRVWGLIAGYEDINDHDHLRKDPIFQVAVGSRTLAGRSTLNRVENTKRKGNTTDRYCKIELLEDRARSFFVDEYLRQVKRAPSRIILDIDANDVRLYGEQEQRHFITHYGGYCYLPLSVYIDDHLVYSKLQPSSVDSATGAVAGLDMVVRAIRKKFPKVTFILRGDSGFARDEVMSWCEEHGVEYVLGLAKNSRLVELFQETIDLALEKFQRDKSPCRQFSESPYRTRESWSCARRVICKAEVTDKGANPRWVVTSLKRKAVRATALYEQWYCPRGNMENRIKEQLQLFSDRLSVHTFDGNQVRLYFSAVAAVIFSAFRRVALVGTMSATSYFNTLRLRLIKIGATVSRSVRRVVIEFPAAFPFQELFDAAHRNLSRHPTSG